jgi:hypothetical protein
MLATFEDDHNVMFTTSGLFAHLTSSLYPFRGRKWRRLPWPDVDELNGEHDGRMKRTKGG